MIGVLRFPFLSYFYRHDTMSSIDVSNHPAIFVLKGVLDQKIHPSIKVRVSSDNFPKIKFRIFLTWRPVLVISVIVARW